jgi:hypothetical protein
MLNDEQTPMPRLSVACEGSTWAAYRGVVPVATGLPSPSAAWDALDREMAWDAALTQRAAASRPEPKPQSIERPARPARPRVRRPRQRA